MKSRYFVITALVTSLTGCDVPGRAGEEGVYGRSIPAAFDVGRRVGSESEPQALVCDEKCEQCIKKPTISKDCLGTFVVQTQRWTE